MAGFRMSPRSPPVQDTTSTSTPSWTYRAIEAAPLLDSSSGWACTAINRSFSRGSGRLARVVGLVVTDISPHAASFPGSTRLRRPCAVRGGGPRVVGQVD